MTTDTVTLLGLRPPPRSEFIASVLPVEASEDRVRAKCCDRTATISAGVQPSQCSRRTWQLRPVAGCVFRIDAGQHPNGSSGHHTIASPRAVLRQMHAYKA